MSRETFTAYRLANMADVSCPDGPGSVGAVWLEGIQDSAAEAYRYAEAEGISEDDVSDMAREIADSAPPVYTHELWRTFVDLGAYSEDVSEYGTDDSDTDSRARIALYMVAERLASALLQEWGEAADVAHAERLERADALGTEHGTAAGSWVIDGNTDEATARQLLAWSEAGDPLFYGVVPDPTLARWEEIQGEITDGETMSADRLHALRVAWEEAYSAAAEEEITRAARAMLGD